MPEFVEISDDDDQKRIPLKERYTRPSPTRLSQTRRSGASKDDPFVIDDPQPSSHKTPLKSDPTFPPVQGWGKPLHQLPNHGTPSTSGTFNKRTSLTPGSTNLQSANENSRTATSFKATSRSKELSQHRPLVSGQYAQQAREAPSAIQSSPTKTAHHVEISTHGSRQTEAQINKTLASTSPTQMDRSAVQGTHIHQFNTSTAQASTPTRSSKLPTSQPSKRKQRPLQNPLNALKKQSLNLSQTQEALSRRITSYANGNEGASSPDRTVVQPDSRCVPCSASDLDCNGLDQCAQCKELGIQCIYIEGSNAKVKEKDKAVNDLPVQEQVHLIKEGTSQLLVPGRRPSTPRQVNAGSILTEVESEEEEDDDDDDDSNDSNINRRNETEVVLEPEYLENLITSLMRQMYEFQEYKVKPLLQQTRLSSSTREIAGTSGPTKSPFDTLRPMSAENQKENGQVLQLHVKDYRTLAHSTKQRSYSVVATITRESPKAAFIPKYKSIGRLAASFLAPNVTVVKYNHYDFDDENYTDDKMESKYEEVKLRYHTYDKISGILHTQRDCAEATDLWRPWAEKLLDQIGLEWDDVVQFYSTDVISSINENNTTGLSYELLSKWTDEQIRECENCKERYEGQREILRNAYKTKACHSRQVLVAGLACLAFREVTGLSMTHIVMTSSWTRSLIKELLSEQHTHGQSKLMMCLVCGLHNCHLHGAYLDDSGLPESFLDDHTNEVKIDDAESKRNTRVTVALPLAHQTSPSTKSSKQSGQKHTMKGLKKVKNDLAKIEQRGFFIPCSHAGPCNDNSACSCFQQKIRCEYICGCDLTCTNRFQGCSCRSGAKEVCTGNANCECWTNSRECDPWLCKGCGVLEVLDQANRYNEEIRRGRCYNNRIQLGIPARTIKAPSEVQGFGLFAGEDLEKGAFIGEYKGEIISQAESDRRGSLYPLLGAEYLFTLNPLQQIDATNFGNKTRFMNNSQLPANINVAGCVMLCNGVQRVMLTADRKIKAGEELQYNYNYPDHATRNFWERGERPPTKRALVEAPVAKMAGTKTNSFPSNVPVNSDELPHSSQPPLLERKGKRRFNDIVQVGDSESDYNESNQASEASETDADDLPSSFEANAEIPTRINKHGKPDGRFGGAAQRKAAQTRQRASLAGQARGR